MASGSQILMGVTPFVAMATLAVGLQVGGGQLERAALISTAPASDGAGMRTFSVMVFDDSGGIREPVSGVNLLARAIAVSDPSQSDAPFIWKGQTNEDGAAEMVFGDRSHGVPASPLRIELVSGTRLLARGTEATPPAARDDAAATAWVPFARREGDVVLEVALLGRRAASGFAASVWVHATDGKTQASLPNVTITIDRDASLTPASDRVTTDSRGWAHVTATPLGYAVALVLHGKAADGRTGEWAGGISVSPGASELIAHDVYRPDEAIVFDVVVPTSRKTAYVEIDDAKGCAWATAARVTPTSSGSPRATVTGPTLAPGLYWLVAAGDASGASLLGAGSSARPFFVAGTPAEALAFGTDASACTATGDVRDVSRVVSACLALVAPVAAPRSLSLDGFDAVRALHEEQRSRGKSIALAALLVALLLETVLILRASSIARTRLRSAEQSEEAGGAKLQSRGWDVAVGVLLGMLGFGLLAALIERLG